MDVSNAANAACMDTLRLSDEEQRRIIESLDRQSAGLPADERRAQPRINYQRQAGMVVEMQHPGGSMETYLVRARNLSRNGIAFLHGGFVYQGTPCSLMLMTKGGNLKKIEGQVRRCQHVRKHIHDIGVRFDEPIRLREFVPEELLTGEEVEISQELPRLRGSILHVEDSVSDQELMRYHLTNLGVEVRTASDGLAALDLAASARFDAVLTGLCLPALSGTELAVCLRSQGFTGAIIGITADERAEARSDALGQGCTRVIIKPYSFKDLADLLAEYLPPATGAASPGACLPSELWGDRRMQPLIRSFVQRLEPQVRQMQQLLQADKTDLAFQKLCLDVKGSAGGYGFPGISQAAQGLLELVAANAASERLRRQLDELAALVGSAAAFLSRQSPGDAGARADATAA
jgi:CheY-like chemotaxis protein